MRGSIAARGRITGLLGAAAVASLLSVFAASAQTSSSTLAEPAPAPSPPQATTAQSDAEWRKAMAQVPVPKKGCFTSSYPSMQWQEVACGPPPKTFNNVGDNFGDYAAQASSGFIYQATGSFMSVSSGISETGNVGGPTGPVQADVYTLQLNTEHFDISTLSKACNGVSGCIGWQQFIFSQTQCPGTQPCIFMEYWRFNVGGTGCQNPWQQGPISESCVFNGASVPVPSIPVSELANVSMIASVQENGLDKLVLVTPSGMPMPAQGNDSVLDLWHFWQMAEFNIFGDGGSTQATFSPPGATIVIQTSILTNGTTNAPSCAIGLGGASPTTETNNLNLIKCCLFAGTIEFMESDPNASAYCGASKLIGDPHLTTINGVHYDFQGAGEFVSLRDPGGTEIQTRQTPIATTFFPGPDPHDGLATCVSINTAVAARVGNHRVSYEPNVSGVPDPSGLQLRVDGALVTLGPQGMDLGNGGRLSKTSTSGGLLINFPDGKELFATPWWWAPEGKWVLDVNVFHVGGINGEGVSVSGLTGPIASDRTWLPALPNGTSMGRMPASLPDRYTALYRTFADAWRVDDKDSLFDYATGTSTATFTMKDWPLQQGPCVVPNATPVQPATEDTAEEVCRSITDKTMQANCMFDVRTTGNTDFAKAYAANQRLQAEATK